MLSAPATDATPGPRVTPLTLRQAAVIFALLVVAGIPHYRILDAALPLAGDVDLDGQMKLHGIEADPGLRAALGWFIGDDPQRVHTFRPVPAFSLWVEYRLWGWTRWPYLVMNLLYMLLTALTLVWLCRILRMPLPFAAGAGALLMLDVTRGSGGVIGGLATRHDILCVLFCLLALCSMLLYLDFGSRRHLAGLVVWSLLAYLSKEMALALLPICAVIALAHWRRRPSRRIALVCVSALAVALVWLGWYRLAELNMAPAPHDSHSFSGMVELLHRRWPRNVFLYVASLCRPLALVWVYLSHIGGWALVSDHRFPWALVRIAMTVLAIVLLMRCRPRWVVVLYVWKVFSYLPVLPLSDAWGWYEYMPHVLDPILPLGFAWVVWEPLGLRDRLLRAWAQRRRSCDAA